MTGFWTVLGCDFAGKSLMLRQLAAEGWPVISYDDPYVRDRPVIRQVRSGLFFDTYRQVGHGYSGELAFSLLTPMVWYLRDEVLRRAHDGPALVDSYYFKLLAKGIVTGIADRETVTLWRSFPPPRGAIFLDVDPEVAWERAGGAANLNPFEHYGREPTRDNFVAFQRDLREAILHEVRDLDVLVLNADPAPGRVLEAVRESLLRCTTTGADAPVTVGQPVGGSFRSSAVSRVNSRSRSSGP
jgi:hypothetical protein